jgi:transposase
MVVADGAGFPLGNRLCSASPAEVRLAQETLSEVTVGKVRRLIADRGYDSDPLREQLAQEGIELICPHRSNRTKPATQDGRKLRRYRKRWKMERLFAWLGNFRRLLVRWERHIIVYQAFFHFACILITLRRF